MCVVCCRAYATFLKKIVDTRDVSDVRNRRDLHGLIDGTKLPPQSVLHDAKRLTQARLNANVGSMSYDRLRALLTFAMTDVTNTRHVAVHGDPAVDSSKMAIITSTILDHLCRDKPALKDLRYSNGARFSSASASVSMKQTPMVPVWYRCIRSSRMVAWRMSRTAAIAPSTPAKRTRR